MRAPATSEAGRTRDLTVDVLVERAAVDLLVPEWQRLARPHATPMALPEWSIAAAETTGEGRWAFVTARRGDELVAVAPFVWRGRGATRRLEVAGAFRVYEPVTIAHADAEALRAVLAPRPRLRSRPGPRPRGACRAARRAAPLRLHGARHGDADARRGQCVGRGRHARPSARDTRDAVRKAVRGGPKD